MKLPIPARDTALRLHQHDKGDLSRPRIEAFIRERFAKIHAAWIDDFLPTLISTGSDNGQLLAAAGFQWAEDSELFLETYLDKPIEACLHDLRPTQIQRRNIIEFGNLATTTPGAIRKLILVLANHFGSRGMDWAVVTLTPTLINSFTHLGLKLHPLAPARPERLRASRSHWGRYYDLNPSVVAIDVRLNQPRLQMLEHLSSQHAHPVTYLLAQEPTHDAAVFHRT